jgi:DNA-binding transcriptional LysR family regulator
MQNIPTELLRAFVTVIDLKGFTRAGERLGRSQPAISLQIKRLQDQIGCPLFDRENGGSNVTEYGRLVETYARRILAINDELVAKIAARDMRGRIRIGVPLEFADPMMGHILSQDWARNADLAFDVVCDIAPNLMAGLKDGAFDFVFAIAEPSTDDGLNASWHEPMVWVGRADMPLDSNRPLRLIAFGEGCPYREAMKAALVRAERPFEIIYTSQCFASIRAAWLSGFGITALPASAIKDSKTVLDKSSGLPSLSDLRAGIFLAGQMSSPDVGPLAMRFAEVLTESYRHVA